MIYRYQVATHNGAGVHGPEYGKFSQARERAVAEANRRSTVVLGPFEVERIGYVERIGGPRRYWMRRGARWVSWDAHKDHTVRRPDFLVYEPFDPAAPNDAASPRQRLSMNEGEDR